VVVVADQPDEHVDAADRPVGHRLDDLDHVERRLAQLDQAYDGQLGAHTARVRGGFDGE